MNNFGGFDVKSAQRTGKVVAESTPWLVIKADVFPSMGANPFVIKHEADIELA